MFPNYMLHYEHIQREGRLIHPKFIPALRIRITFDGLVDVKWEIVFKAHAFDYVAFERYFFRCSLLCFHVFWETSKESISSLVNLITHMLPYDKIVRL
jgi:hypothetical protein